MIDSLDAEAVAEDAVEVEPDDVAVGEEGGVGLEFGVEGVDVEAAGAGAVELLEPFAVPAFGEDGEEGAGVVAVEDLDADAGADLGQRGED